MAATAFILLVFTAYFHFVNANTPCTLPQGGPGSCKALHECPYWKNIVDKPRKTNSDVQLLTMLSAIDCGEDRKDERGTKVCCPPACSTPEGNTGACIKLMSCPSIAKRLRPNPTEEAIQYIQNRICLSPEDQSVCCPVKKRLTSLSSLECAERFTVFPPDPKSGCCGRDSFIGNKIVGGVDTKIEEHPWLALLEYEKPNGIELSCGGFLISSRYVITAAHCVFVNLEKNITTPPTKVRLGEYNILNAGIDCTTVEGDGKTCTDGHISIEIESIYPYYEYKLSGKYHDIALIRLKHSAPYTDFIRPICLPSIDVTSNSTANLTLWAAGWGAVSETNLFSQIKQQVNLHYLTKEKCAEAKTPVSRGQLCAGGVIGMDTCKGDSGGPLMYENESDKYKFFEAIGVVSYGPIPCGQINKPAVYTNILSYMPWIRNTIVL